MPSLIPILKIRCHRSDPDACRSRKRVLAESISGIESFHDPIHRMVKIEAAWLLSCSLVFLDKESTMHDFQRLLFLQPSSQKLS